MARDFDDRRATMPEITIPSPRLPSSRGSQLPGRDPAQRVEPRSLMAHVTATLSRSSTTLFLALLLVSAGLLMRRGELVAMSLPFVLYSGIWALAQTTGSRPPLTIRRDLERTRVTEDDPVRISVTITNQGRRLPLIAIEDIPPKGSSAIDGSPRFLGGLAAGASITLQYKLREPRGRFDFPGVRVITWSLLGTSFVESIYDCSDTLHAAPAIEPLGVIPIRPRRTRAFAGSVKANLGGDGVDFFGCRAYTPGDPIRRINWRAYARGKDLIVNDFEQERIADVSIIVDARAQAHAVVGSETTFEHTLRAAASISDSFLGQGNSVGLLLYGDFVNWVFPDVGTPQRQRILDALSRARVGNKVAFEDLRFIPTRLFPPRSQLVLITSLPSAKDVEILSMLRARGYAILLICPSPLKQAADLGDKATDLSARVIGLRRAHFLDSLAGLGIQVVDWDIGSPLAAALDRVRHSQRGRRR